jgi:hypothetical protein
LVNAGGVEKGKTEKPYFFLGFCLESFLLATSIAFTLMLICAPL